MSEIREVPRLAYTIAEACEASTLKRTKLYELLDAGEIRSIHVGRRRLIPAESLRQFCEGGPDDTAA